MGHLEIVKYLIDKGAYIHTRTSAGWTPLILAVYGGHMEIVKILANTDIRLDFMNDYEKNAIYYAAVYKREDIVKFLIEEGAKIEVFNKGGDDLFASGVIYKSLASINEDDDNYQEAKKIYRTAAEYFKKAESELLKEADEYRKDRNRQQLASLLSSVAGIVASSVDLANIKQGNPTYYSRLLPETETANMDEYEIMIKLYQEKAKDCSNERLKCLEKANKLKKLE